MIAVVVWKGGTVNLVLITNFSGGPGMCVVNLQHGGGRDPCER